jgi:hypothetical protein
MGTQTTPERQKSRVVIPAALTARAHLPFIAHIARPPRQVFGLMGAGPRSSLLGAASRIYSKSSAKAPVVPNYRCGTAPELALRTDCTGFPIKPACSRQAPLALCKVGPAGCDVNPVVRAWYVGGEIQLLRTPRRSRFPLVRQPDTPIRAARRNWSVPVHPAGP